MLQTRRLLAASLLSVAACAPAGRPPTTASATPATPATPAAVQREGGAGTLLVVGGGPIPESVTRRFVELAGGPGRARIVVFPTASADSSSGPEKAAQLRSFGAEAVSYAPTRAEAAREESARVLDGATGIWFTGGDQNRITATMAGTPLARAVAERYRAGAVIGGTSAGAAVMSERMITGDESRPGGARPSSDAWLTIEPGNVGVASGLGLLPGAIVDQHFVRRKRHNRLLSLVLEHPERLGVGIDESTAIEVGADGVWRVRGASVAVVYDARPAVVWTPSTAAGASGVGTAGAVDGAAPLGASGVRMHLLPAGATFDPASGNARLP